MAQTGAASTLLSALVFVQLSPVQPQNEKQIICAV